MHNTRKDVLTVQSVVHQAAEDGSPPEAQRQGHCQHQDGVYCYLIPLLSHQHQMCHSLHYTFQQTEGQSGGHFTGRLQGVVSEATAPCGQVY